MLGRGRGALPLRRLFRREPADPTAVALYRDEGGDRTDERQRSGVIDAIRALAALMVLVAHASFVAGGVTGEWSLAVRDALGAGVLLFFALSGYLIAGPFLRALVRGDAAPESASYLVRRAARIYPAYWVALAGVLLLLYPSAGVEAYQLPVHALLLHSAWPVANEPYAIFFVAWSLGIEILFYLFVPLAFLALRFRHPGPWRPERLALIVLAAAVLSVGWSIVAREALVGHASGVAALARGGPHTFLWAFCSGMLVALAELAPDTSRLSRGFRAVMRRPHLTLPLAAAVWMVPSLVQGLGHKWVQGAQVAPFLASGLLLGTAVVAGAWVHPVARLLAPIGLISYGIYLWHDIVVEVLAKHSLGFDGTSAPWLGNIFVVFAITVPIAAASWIWIERPSIRHAAAWARRRQRRVPERAGVTS